MLTKKNYNISISSGLSLVVKWLRIVCQCRGHMFDSSSAKTPCKIVTENQLAHNFVVSIHILADLVLEGSAHSQAAVSVRI